MPWTIDRFLPTHPELTESYLLAVGKTLSLANNFEGNCKYVWRMLQVADAIEEGHNHDFVWELMRTLQDNMLGQTIRSLQGMPHITQGELDILQAAKDSRNFIAHEGVRIGVHSRPAQIQRAFEELEPHVEALAKGDNLVAGWCYEISEKEYASSQFMYNYVFIIKSWIFPGRFDYQFVPKTRYFSASREEDLKALRRSCRPC